MFSKIIPLLALLFLSSCQPADDDSASAITLLATAKPRLNIYKEVPLNVDLTALSKQQQQLIVLLIEAAEIMDDLFWQQSFGQNKTTFLKRIKDLQARNFAEINYGPWDRLNNNQVFLTGFEQKPLGAQFYPNDFNKADIQSADITDPKGLYSKVIKTKNGQLQSIAYSELYADELNRAAAILEKAATLASDSEFAQYLNLRALALKTDQYQASDIAWMEMKNNLIDVVIGPIETYEDQLFGYRAAFEAYVLLKDKSWSEKLSKYTQLLPQLQKDLPVAKKYKQEQPGSNADLNAYDVLYYAGHANAGSKTIAINLPNDEAVQLSKGTRRLQLKNALQAKFDHILVPIADQLIAESQRQFINFNAFFANTMFHEIAHGLGIKNTINGKGSVREALKEHASALEEGKADVLGLHMISQLIEQGELTEGTVEEYYTTFLAGIFRSVRFGASSAHGKANMIRFNYFAEQQAFQRDEQGFYHVNVANMAKAIKSLSAKILTLQGDGDYEEVTNLFQTMGNISPQLQSDLNKLTQADIPVDIVFKQGKKVLGL
ncbi:MAG: dipeptidyl-peptidase 3 family protein [Thalassotalea sp.]